MMGLKCGVPESMKYTLPMTDPTRQIASFLVRAEKLLERLEPLLPPASQAPDWSSATAFRWRKHGHSGYLQAVLRPSPMRLDDLQDIDDQKSRIDAT